MNACHGAVTTSSGVLFVEEVLYVFECGSRRKVGRCGRYLIRGNASTSRGAIGKEDWDVFLFLLVGELCVAGGEGFNGFAQDILASLSDNLFGRPAFLCDGVVAGVPVFACSGLTSGGRVPVVVEEALFHVGC